MMVVVTGAGGFVGRQLCAALSARGDNVIALDSQPGKLDGVTWVAGDLADCDVRARALAGGCDAIVHLATIPGGAAEANPELSRRINIDAMYDLLLEASAAGARPRVVYASSIAVFGDPLPAAGVDDDTPLSPKLVYGGHKAMMEIAVAMLSNRGQIDGISLRLPGILARPKGPSGMKSAFMSDLFHALKAKQPFVCPVSAEATIWAQSRSRCVANLVRALDLPQPDLPPGRALTLPALRIRMADLIAEVAHQCDAPRDLVTCQPDAALEAAFGAQPPLSTPNAERAGFAHDGDLAKLVSSALSTLD